MSLLYKDIDPELLGYGSDNNKKPLPSKEQRNLADAVSANSSAASTEEVGGAMNNFRFAQKGVVEGVLGAPVDAVGGLINEARAGYSAFQGGMANLVGKPEDHTPLKPIDFSSAFGGTESFKSGFENIGAPVIDRDPQTTGEKASYIVGENSNLLPVGKALTTAKAVKSGINASRTMSMVPAGDNGAPPEIDRLADEPNYLQDRFPSPSSTPSAVSNATAPSGELNEAATLAMNPAGFPVAAPVAAPVVAPVARSEEELEPLPDSRSARMEGAKAGKSYRAEDGSVWRNDEDGGYNIEKPQAPEAAAPTGAPTVADPVAAPTTPTTSPTLPSASSSQAFDMPMTGMRPIDPTTGGPLSQQAIDAANRAGLELPMGNVPQAPQAPQAPQSPRDIAVAQQEARLQELRNGAGLSPEAQNVSGQNNQGLSDAAKIVSGQMEAPEGFYNPAPATPADNVQQSPVGDDTIADFLDFKESGKPMTQDMVDKADDLAMAAGRTFDPETGYSKDFDPLIKDIYDERIAADKATQEVDPSKPAPKDTPEESKTQDQIDYEAEVQEDEQGIIDKARERGESQEYIDEMLEGVRERRGEAEAEQSLDDLKTQLQIKKMRLENRKLEGELNDNGPEEVDLPKVKSLYGMMDDQGVKQDPQTGAITVTEEGFLGDSDSALAPNSSLFQQLARTPEGRYILNTRPPEINSVKDPDPAKLYEADDGRYFNYDGESWSVIVNF